MNGKCFEVGTIQAFLDGETAPDFSYKVTNHIAACPACARLLAEAEEETSIVFSALDREFTSLVPTQRLWSRINESIAIEKSRTPFWKKIGYALSAVVASPSIAVAASVFIVFGLFAAVWNLRSDVEKDSRAASSAPRKTIENPPVGSLPSITTASSVMPQFSPAEPLTVKSTKLSPEKLQKLVTSANYTDANNRSKPQYVAVRSSTAPAAEYLTGEESYVKTIADLKQNIDVQKDSVLNPSSRVAYERDMAVVNDAITKMKEVVRKNPRNQSAKQVLYSSYQNKIDLLNSVAEREELMASLK